MPFIDEIVGSIVTKSHSVGTLDNTVFIFLSLPAERSIDNIEIESSPLENNIRRIAFIYSHSLLLPQSISNHYFHISDFLPTLVNVADLKWRTRDRIYIDGVNQWATLNTNENGVRDSIYGDNFYIDKNWKLSYGTSNSIFYDSITNNNMEKENVSHDDFDLNTYVKSIMSSDINSYFDDLSSNKIILMRNRAKVHCNLNDVDNINGSAFLRNIKCSRDSPCLFDLESDPCEFDDKHEHEFDLKRNQMKTTFEKYLNDGIIRDFIAQIDDTTVSAHSDGGHTSHEHESVTNDPILSPGGGFGAFLTLMVTLFAFIFTLILIACIKERCNSRRSVYVDKSTKNKVTFKDESGTNGISTISSKVQSSHL